MSWVPCKTCEGDRTKRDGCEECHGNGGAFVSEPAPAPAPKEETKKDVRRG